MRRLRKKSLEVKKKPHCSGELRKAIMKRSRFKNVSRKSGKPEDRRAYQKQRNLVVKLNSQHKKSYFRSITPQNSKTSLWKICKPYFSNKGVNRNKPILLENDVIFLFQVNVKRERSTQTWSLIYVTRTN